MWKPDPYRVVLTIDRNVPLAVAKIAAIAAYQFSHIKVRPLERII